MWTYKQEHRSESKLQTPELSTQRLLKATLSLFFYIFFNYIHNGRGEWPPPFSPCLSVYHSLCLSHTHLTSRQLWFTASSSSVTPGYTQRASVAIRADNRLFYTSSFRLFSSLVSWPLRYPQHENSDVVKYLHLNPHMSNIFPNRPFSDHNVLPNKPFSLFLPGFTLPLTSFLFETFFRWNIKLS